MQNATLYDKSFYNAQSKQSYESARIMLPYVDKIFHPKSVIDVGCGVGTWLKAWKDINPSIYIAGIDGNDVSEDMFFIPKDCYKRVDLTKHCEILSQEISQHFTNAVNGGGGGSLLS